jgi:hypothetical protein
MSQAVATASDAEIVLKLYELRRETVMRQARKWFSDFNPSSAVELLRVQSAWGSQENAYFRQVVSYWDMAAALVNRGAVHPGLFLDWSGEMIFVFSKLAPYLEELRKASHDYFAANIEQVIAGSPEAEKRLAAMIEKNKARR